jgi:hypothetical protein
LQHAKELHLHLDADLADLVEEQRATLGLLEEAALLGARPREAAALVAEELTLEDGLRERAAVDGDEGLVVAGALGMDRTSSLPVPLSPTMSTVAVVGATWATVL